MGPALLTTYLSDYRVPLYQSLAERDGLEVLCYGRGARYAPPWFTDLDGQLARAPFPARRIKGPREAAAAARDHDLIVAPFAGGAMLPAAYFGARRQNRPFVLWASVWAEPRSIVHDVTLPLIRHIYRDADAVVAYGEHVKAFVAALRGHDEDVVVAPQAVEPDLFARTVEPSEVEAFRARHDLAEGPFVLYVGRLVPEKGIEVLARAWRDAPAPPALVGIGDGPLAHRFRGLPRARFLGPLPRAELPVAYAAAAATVVPSIPTPRFREPWGLVCNEAMHQGCPVVATTAVGAVAGGLVRDGETGLVVPAGDAAALAGALERILTDPERGAQLGAAGREAVAPYTYAAMTEAFERAFALARARRDSLAE